MEISTTVQQSFETVSELIEQFDEFKGLFTPVFLSYNGNTQNISIEYKLRTCHSFLNENEFVQNLLIQYLNNPIQIPSHLYTVQIYDQKTFEDLANNPKYFIKKEGFYLFNLTELYNRDSEFITIFINSNFILDFNFLIKSHISKQPRVIAKNTLQYELISLLTTDLFPKNFQCFNIPIHFDLNLNQFLEYYIPKKFLMAMDKYIWMERKRILGRKKKVYAKMIDNKFAISPLEFSDRIQLALSDITKYIQENFNTIIQIKNEKGIITPEIPHAYHHIKKTGLIYIRFKFRTNLNNTNPGVKALLLFNFKWMGRIFKKFLNF